VGAVAEGGEVAFTAEIGSNRAQGVFFDFIDAVVAVALPGETAAGGWRFAERPGGVGGIAAPVSMNRSGDLAFAADLLREEETGSGTFLWERATGGLTAISLPGMAAPDGSLVGSTRSPASINDRGAVAFSVELLGPDGTPGEAILLRTPERGAVIARTGDPAPGGGFFTRVGRPSLASGGQVAFEGEVVREDERARGIFLWDGQRLDTAVAAGMRLPGGMLGDLREPRLNENGDLVFFGDTEGVSVYLVRETRVSRLAGPGTEPSGAARVVRVVTGDGALVLNQRGMVALILELEESSGAGVFVHHQDGLWPVALPGTFLAGIGPMDDVGPTVALSDAGHVCFQAELADGEVVLVLATPVPGGG
jgi:hypothetical protein